MFCYKKGSPLITIAWILEGSIIIMQIIGFTKKKNVTFMEAHIAREDKTMFGILRRFLVSGPSHAGSIKAH